MHEEAEQIADGFAHGTDVFLFRVHRLGYLLRVECGQSLLFIFGRQVGDDRILGWSLTEGIKYEVYVNYRSKICE